MLVHDRAVQSVGFDSFPEDVQEVLGLIDSMFPQLQDRRMIPRWAYRAAATFDRTGDEPALLWTRDLNAWNVGFVARHQVRSGLRGRIRFEVPGGDTVEVRGRIARCREFVPGWYEGYVDFLDTVPAELLARTT